MAETPRIPSDDKSYDGSTICDAISFAVQNVRTYSVKQQHACFTLQHSFVEGISEKLVDTAASNSNNTSSKK